MGTALESMILAKIAYVELIHKETIRLIQNMVCSTATLDSSKNLEDKAKQKGQGWRYVHLD